CAEHSRKLLSVFAKARVIGHYIKFRDYVERSDCIEKRRNHQCARRKQCAHLVLDNVAKRAVPNGSGHRLSDWILVDGAEHDLAAVARCESKRTRLIAAALL